MQYYIGMMSGTSLDGVDAVLAGFDGLSWRVVAHADIALPKTLTKSLLRLNCADTRWEQGELHASKQAEYELTHCYAIVYRLLMEKSVIDAQQIIAIGAHGQTIRHEPSADTPYSLQLLNGALLSELTGQSVVCDFRSRDIAAGGQGAPFAPLFHPQLFALDSPFAVANIGGIANVSLLAEKTGVQGFDCGPGNCLLDEWIARHQGKAFDYHGEWAQKGEVLPLLLAQLLKDPYFHLSPPKSTGRDYFHLAWLSQYLEETMRPEDVMRTLVVLTAQVLVSSLPDDITQLVIVGGGAKNQLLMAEIQQLFNARQSSVGEKRTVVSSSALGIDVQHVEAIGFAVLAKDCIEQKKLDTTRITGANHPVVLGAVYHY